MSAMGHKPSLCLRRPGRKWTYSITSSARQSTPEDAERAARGPGLNQSLLREKRKLPFAWRRLDHLGEQFSIVEELGQPQARGRGAAAPWFVGQPPGLSFMM
jgi:hypothetical protein